MEICEKHQDVVEKIIANTVSLENNWGMTKQNQARIAEVEKTHAILSSLQAEIKGINEKLVISKEDRVARAKESKMIVDALANNKKTLTDRILDTIIPAMVYGSLLAYFINILILR